MEYKKAFKFPTICTVCGKKKSACIDLKEETEGHTFFDICESCVDEMKKLFEQNKENT